MPLTTFASPLPSPSPLALALSLSFFVRRLLSVHLIVVLLLTTTMSTTLQNQKGSILTSVVVAAAAASTSTSGNIINSDGNNNKRSAAGNGFNGFNHEIEKRVLERVSELMNRPVTMLGLVERYSRTDVFEPPFLRPHQRDELFRLLWTVWDEFENIDLYYGQEDGLFLGVIKGSGTYLEGRGTNGYHLDDDADDVTVNDNGVVTDEDRYMKRLYYNQCLDRETGASQNCTLKENEDYVACVNNCRLSPCPSSLSASSSASTTTRTSSSPPSSPMIYCPTYDVLQVPATATSRNGDDENSDSNNSMMGYIPRYYYCLNNAGKFIENNPPNSVASPSSMKNGVCTHSDGVTLVEGKTSVKRTYAVADRRNYLFLQGSSNNNSNSSSYEVVPSTTPAAVLYSAEEQDDNDQEAVTMVGVDESQKTDQVFVGGHHSRRYEPRLRPWYIGTRNVQNAFWTKPYPFATNNDMGISYGKPLYYTDPSTGHQVFRGVISVDFNLEVISRFLRGVFLEIMDDSGTNGDQEKEKDEKISSSRYTISSSGATVLIVEDNEPYYIIGSSTGSKAAKKVRVDDESIDCDDEEIFTGEYECKTVRSTPKDFAHNSIIAADNANNNTNSMNNNNNNMRSLDGIMASAFEAQKEAGFPKAELVVSSSAAAAADAAAGGGGATASKNDKDKSDGDNDNDNVPDFFVSQSLIYEHSEGENLRWRIIVAMPVGLATNEDDLLWGDPMFVVVLAVSLWGFVSCVVLFYYYFTKRGRTEVAMSDWRFTSAFILGCALLNLTSLTSLGPTTTDAICMLRMWAFHFCFVLALTPLLVKVWRIYKLVGAAGRAVRLSITNQKAMVYTFPAILLQILILTLFSIFDPASKHTYVEIDGNSSSQHCICKHDTNAFVITQIIFEGGLVLIGCILAYKTRNLGSTLGEAKQLLFAMYNVALVALIVVLMRYFLVNDQKSVYVIMTVGVFWATVFSSCAFVLPRLLQVQRNAQRRSSMQLGRKSSPGYQTQNSVYKNNNYRSGAFGASDPSMHNVGGSMTPVPRRTSSISMKSCPELPVEAAPLPKMSDIDVNDIEEDNDNDNNVLGKLHNDE